MVRFNSAGRIQPTEYRNLLQPGQCVLCNRIGRKSEEIFANFGVELEFYGIVYLCQDCCYEVVDFMEAIPAYEANTLRNDILEIEEKLDQVERENAFLKELLNVRIEFVGSGQPVLHGADGTVIFKDDDAPTGTHQNLDADQSEPSQSGKS